MGWYILLMRLHWTGQGMPSSNKCQYHHFNSPMLEYPPSGLDLHQGACRMSQAGPSLSDRPLAPAVGDICLFVLSSEQKRCHSPKPHAVSSVLRHRKVTVFLLPGTRCPSLVAIYKSWVRSAASKATQNSTKFLPIPIPPRQPPHWARFIHKKCMQHQVSFHCVPQLGTPSYSRKTQTLWCSPCHQRPGEVDSGSAPCFYIQVITTKAISNIQNMMS